MCACVCTWLYMYTDADSCKYGTPRCDDKATCVPMTRGFKKCSCKAGFTGDGTKGNCYRKCSVFLIMMNPRFEEHQILEPGEVVLDVRLCSSFPCPCQFRLHAYFQKPLMSLRFISLFSWKSLALCFVRRHQELLLRSCVDVILFKYVSCIQFKKASLTLSQPRGGHIVPPPPPQVYFLKYLKNAFSYCHVCVDLTHLAYDVLSCYGIYRRMLAIVLSSWLSLLTVMSDWVVL